MDNKIQINKNIILNMLFLLFIIMISILFYMLNISYELKLFLFSWLGNIVLIYGIHLFKKIKHTHINPYTLFFISYYLFSYGQQFLFSIGVEYEKFNLLKIFLNEEIIQYCLYFCVGTSFLLIGALIAIKKDIEADDRMLIEKEKNDQVLNSSIKKIAIPMFLISLPIYMKSIITNMINSIKYGYNYIYTASDSDSISNIIDSLGMWFVPAVFLLIVIYKKNKFVVNALKIILLFVIIAIFITGARSRAMALILSLIYLWNSEMKKFSFKSKVLVLFGILFIMTLLPIIQVFRGTETKTIQSFSSFFIEMYEGNLIFDIIGELGSSMQPWLLVQRLIPTSYPFHYGQSYLASLLAIIPSIFFGGFSFTQYAHLSGWLQEAASMSYGPGFSMLAESYYNFGWLGMIFMCFIGWMYFKFISNNMFKSKIIRYKNTLSAIALYAFITTARGSVYLSIRTEVYAILIPILLIIIIYNTSKKNMKDNVK